MLLPMLRATKYLTFAIKGCDMKKLLFVLAMVLTVAFSASAFANSGTVTGQGGGTACKWMGLTALSYDGNDALTYAGADALCVANYAGSHVCWVDEIGYLLRKGSLPAAGEGWINDGPPGYTANANDCIGWSTTANFTYGRYWDFVNKQGWLRGCASSVQFACCK